MTCNRIATLCAAEEESDEDDEPEAASVTVEEMEEWKAN